MDNCLTFEKQIVLLKKKSFNMLRKISKIRYLLSEVDLKIVVNSLVVSCLDYCNAIYHGINGNLIHQLQFILNAAAAKWKNTPRQKNGTSTLTACSQHAHSMLTNAHSMLTNAHRPFKHKSNGQKIH